LYAQLPKLAVCELIQQHARRHAPNKLGGFGPGIILSMDEDGLYIKKKQNKQHPIVEDNSTSEQDIYIK